MDPSCLVTTVQAGCGGVMVWGMLSWYTLGPLVPIGHCLNGTAYLSIVSDHVHYSLKKNWVEIGQKHFSRGPTVQIFLASDYTSASSFGFSEKESMMLLKNKSIQFSYIVTLKNINILNSI